MAAATGKPLIICTGMATVAELDETVRAAREEGLLVGISSGATLAAIAQKLPEIAPGATVLGFNYDTGERYLSVEGFLPAP